MEIVSNITCLDKERVSCTIRLELNRKDLAKNFNVNRYLGDALTAINVHDCLIESLRKLDDLQNSPSNDDSKDTQCCDCLVE